ncbi:MAG TPA: endonuclease/exonuclease/phosphatase family protein [Chlamydiales bacterium]|nr:endonuclease/exonuclease/phosphatase family protein [Chlamydiales bacterium]
MIWFSFFLSLFTISLTADIQPPATYMAPKEQLYSYKKGNGAEKGAFPTNKIMTLNACMLDGVLPVKYGGMTRADKRVKRLTDLIKKQDPDIYLGQEITLASGTLIYDQLKSGYPHFWIGMGINDGNSGLFVASKYPIISEPKFFPFPESMQRPADRRIMDRGFFCLETPKYWIATSHFEGGSPKDVGAFRRDELKFVTQTMDKISNGKPYILAGDLNITRTGEPDDEYSQSGIQEYYYDFYTEHHPQFNADTFTNTNLFTARANGLPEPKLETDRNEIDDYFLIRKPYQKLFKNLNVVINQETYNLDEPTEKAITDHRAYIATFSI